MGVLFIFVKMIVEFGILVIFGCRIGFYVLILEIYKFILSWLIDFSSVIVLFFLLFSVCMFIWYM